MTNEHVALAPMPAAHPGASDASGSAQVTTPMTAVAAAAQPNVANATAAFDHRRLSPEQLRAVIMNSFTGPIERVRPTLAYRVGALVTASFMILLPLLYVGIIALVIWGVYLHAVHNTGILGVGRGRGAALAFLIYLAPLAIGAILIFFMIKPLFAGKGRSARTRSLTPMSDPLLFQFVERLCELVRAPMPQRIDIDCEVNASAGFRRGWLSFLTGNDLVLTIGMPLAAGMTLQQFAGVLAHEFGHFAQGTGMRLTYVIRSVNFWFMRVVYERDAWDEWLENSTEGLDLRISWIFYLARLFVWLTRKILWVLMMVGNAVSGFMMRQMEFDADRYEARLVGSQVFEEECKQLMLLNFAYRGAQADLGMFFREGRLADDLPKLIMANVRQMPEEVKEIALKIIDESKTGLFDTHPSDKERIASAYAEQAAGVFRSTLPASALFANFEAASKGVTRDYYDSIFDNRIPANALRPVEELVASQGAEKEKFEARDRYFMSPLSGLRPLRLPSFHITRPENPQGTKQQIAASRELMQREAKQYQDDHKAYDDLDTRALHALQAGCLYSNGLSPKPKQFEPPLTSQAHSRQEYERCRTQMAQLGQRMERFEIAAGSRLHGALALLNHPALATKMNGSDQLQRECHALLPVVALVSNQLETILKMRDMHARMAALIEQLSGGKKSDSAIRDLLDITGRLADEVRSLHNMLGRHDYPFDHADGTITIARYTLRIPPPRDELGAVYEGTETFLDNLLNLYSRSVSRLCAIAESIEKRLGFEPLKPAAEPQPQDAG